MTTACFKLASRLTDTPLNDYDEIADTFDYIMADDFHQVTHAIRMGEIQRIAVPGSIRCLDLCCGTGLFFELLTQQVPIEGVGIDLSKNQIRMAKKRNSSAKFIVGDVRTSQFPCNRNLITINFDALNHIVGRDAWLDIFRRSFLALEVGGILLFDINLPERLHTDWNQPEVIIKDEASYIQVARDRVIDGRGDVARQIDMTIFKMEDDGRFVQRRATILQYSLTTATVIRLLKQSGFERPDIILEAGDQAQGHIFNRNRAFIVARK